MNASALERFGRFPLYISTPIAAVIAAVAAGIAHLIIGDLLGGVPDGFEVDTSSGRQDLVFGSSMFATFLYVLLGGLVYALVRRFARDY
jgi:membrane protease YdiL (CAAX protease family)